MPKQEHTELIHRVDRIENVVNQSVKKVIETDNQIAIIEIWSPEIVTLERLDQERVVTVERLRRVAEEVAR